MPAVANPVSFPNARFRWLETPFVRIAIGSLLLVAAAFKAHALWTDSAQPIPLFASLRVQVAVIEIEFVLGLWLLSGYYFRAASWVALIFFVVLACVSGYLGLSGESSCGCLGRIKLNPWLMFVVDLGAIAALACARPPRVGVLGPNAGSSRLTPLAVLAPVLLLSVALAGFFALANDPLAVLARLRGEAIAVEPAVSDVGTGVPGEERTVAVQVVNHTDHPVQFMGGSTTCACMATDDLPFTLSPGESRSIHVRLRFSGGAGTFQHQFILFTDDENQNVVVARLAGRVEKPAD